MCVDGDGGSVVGGGVLIVKATRLVFLTEKNDDVFIEGAWRPPRLSLSTLSLSLLYPMVAPPAPPPGATPGSAAPPLVGIMGVEARR